MLRTRAGVIIPADGGDGFSESVADEGEFMKIDGMVRARAVTRARGLLVVAATAILLQSGPAFARDDTASEAGLGIGSALCSLIYGPAKVVYATLGTVFGGMAWGLSGGDSDVLHAVITPAVRGDYVVTPAHLLGKEPLEFFGHRPGYGETQESAVVEDDFEATY